MILSQQRSANDLSIHTPDSRLTEWRHVSRDLVVQISRTFPWHLATRTFRERLACNHVQCQRQNGGLLKRLELTLYQSHGAPVPIRSDLPCLQAYHVPLCMCTDVVGNFSYSCTPQTISTWRYRYLDHFPLD